MIAYCVDSASGLDRDISLTTADIWIGRRAKRVKNGFSGFGYSFLLTYQMMPVSLDVTISMVMFIQAIFMTWDLDMYSTDADVRRIVRSMGLNEELGQISYVYSDKKGHVDMQRDGIPEMFH
ncbi:hypothetical protein PsorP6_011292 [Peronosclerospora sorghi]|uniref:Uncharacterized protein n=1 Tax=Peronosclerospora sorghi TaxID=230839 RepID=A0ACC0WJE9_9STRA|nr:hypothetical protein PsorP6_011292 [Peronosclerospora sorghi]